VPRMVESVCGEVFGTSPVAAVAVAGLSLRMHMGQPPQG
jgi:hypothetical protein